MADDLLDLTEVPALDEPVFLASLDGWTDAGGAGTTASALLSSSWKQATLGAFRPDRLFDYRDRRPMLPIDMGVLGQPVWPELALDLLRSPAGHDIVLLTGGEPDFAWQSIIARLVELTRDLGITRYVGLGSVPGPVPHTRAVRVTTTSSQPEMIDRHGGPHERVVVPASFQVMLEAGMRDAGLQTLGLWARIPHYVGGDYPQGAIALLRKLAVTLGTVVDTSDLEPLATANEARLADAASGSSEVADHITTLEEMYDADAPEPDLPSGDEIAAEFERFLRDRPEAD